MEDRPRPKRGIRRVLLLIACALAGWYVLAILWSFLIMVLIGFEELMATAPEESVEAFLGWYRWRDILVPIHGGAEEMGLIWIPTGVIVLTQCAMLLPAVRPVRIDGRPRRPWFAGVVGGILATIITGALLFTLTDLPRVPVGLDLVADSPNQSARSSASNTVDMLLTSWMPIFPLGILIVSWVFWTWLLLAQLRRAPTGWFGRMVGVLLAGSLVELAIALPIYVIVRRRFDCYCALPSFWAVIASMAVVLALTGPGAVLLWRRRAGLPSDGWTDRCLVCGYGRGPQAGPRCPECGTRWGRIVAAGDRD